MAQFCCFDFEIQIELRCRHLDISQSEEKFGVYAEPNKMLSKLVENLPNLTSLDISGTNLAGTGGFDSDEMAEAAAKLKRQTLSCDIPGLMSREANPLEFLGLYKTLHEACLRPHIPAKRVSKRCFFELKSFNFGLLIDFRRLDGGTNFGGRNAVSGPAGRPRKRPQRPLPHFQIRKLSGFEVRFGHYSHGHGSASRRKSKIQNV